MKTYEIIIEKKSVYIKTDAPSEAIQGAINFVPKGSKYIERLLQGLRLQGFKATPITIEPVDIFEV